MQQKEVLLIVGVLAVGLFLLNNGMLSGRSVYGGRLVGPNQEDFNIGNVGSDAFDDGWTGASTTGGEEPTCGCPPMESYIVEKNTCTFDPKCGGECYYGNIYWFEPPNWAKSDIMKYGGYSIGPMGGESVYPPVLGPTYYQCTSDGKFCHAVETGPCTSR